MTAFTVINGQTYDATAISLPPEGRLFRDAWSDVNSGVVIIDIDEAKRLRVTQLIAELEQDAKDAEKEAHLAELSGEPQEAAAARARRDRRRAPPNINAIRNAPDVATLAALTMDDIS